MAVSTVTGAAVAAAIAARSTMMPSAAMMAQMTDFWSDIANAFYTTAIVAPGQPVTVNLGTGGGNTSGPGALTP